MLYAAQHAERVCSLILEDTALLVDNNTREDSVDNISHRGIPVLILWGEKDTLIPLEVGKAVHSRIATSELKIYRNAGHVPHWEIPDEYNAAIIDFIQRKTC